MGKEKKKNMKFPFVSVCTPTFNRRPFIPTIIKCFENQTYPKDRIEWLIIDDGTDKVEDLFVNVPQVQYFRYEQKMTLGNKRNLLNDKAKGDYIIYMDDDDYYPPERISHAVLTLQNSPNALCAGSSAMYIYFKHINKMLQFGPYGPNHSTAATFAFKKELLKITKFDETSSVAEERKFLKDYTIPFVQLESIKSILVFSHNHNSFDKKELLMQMPNPHIHDTPILPSDIVKEPEILNFFMNDINFLLDLYEPGKPIHKPDVTKQIAEIKEKREIMIKQQIAKQNEFQSTLNNLQGLTNPHFIQNTINQQVHIIQQLTTENKELKEKNNYLESKLKQIIDEIIKEKINEKKILSEQNIKIVYS